MTAADALPGGRIDWDLLGEANPHHGVRSRRLDTETLTIIRYELDAGARYPLHTHELEHFVHGVVGSATVALGDDELDLAPGELVHVPVGVTHGVTAGDAGATFLNIGPSRSRRWEGGGGHGLDRSKRSAARPRGDRRHRG